MPIFVNNMKKDPPENSGGSYYHQLIGIGY